GQAPYGGSDVLIRAAGCDWQPVRQIMREVPAALEAVCTKAMAAEPRQRYATARQMAEEIERWLADEPVQAGREPWRERARRWARRHQTLVSSAVAALLVALVGLGGGLMAVAAEQGKTARERDRANDERDRANEAKQEAKDNLHKARKNLKLAKDNLK